MGEQWLGGRVLDSRPRGHRLEPHWRHCVVVLEQDTFILVQPRKTPPCLTERLLMGRKESNQTKLAGIFIWRYWWYKQKSPKYETVKYSFGFSYTINNTCKHILRMLVSVSINQLMNSVVCLHLDKNSS